MTLQQSLLHILRYAWLWPLEFWLRPVSVILRGEKNPYPEMVAAGIGGGIWGALAGTGLWLLNGDPQSILIVAFAVAVAFASVAVAFASVAVAFASVAVAFASVAVAGASVAGAGASVAVAGASVAVAGASGAVASVAGAGAGILLGSWLDPTISSALLLGVVSVNLISIIVNYFAKDDSRLKSWSETSWALTWLIGFPVAGFMQFPALPVHHSALWGIILLFSFGFGIIAGFFDKIRDDLTLKGAAPLRFLTIFYAMLWSLAIIAWLPTLWLTSELGTKLETLAYFLAATPILWTGLPFYPLLALLAVWQYRSSQATRFTPERFALTIPLRWQTFAYPLPRLRRYLFAVAQQQGMPTALAAIQQIQQETLQVNVAQRAIYDLAQQPETALDFCGTVAITTQKTTTISLSLTGIVGRAIAILAPEDENLTRKQKRRALELWIGKFPPPTALFNNKFSFLRRKTESATWFNKFDAAQQANLITRIEYALNQLESCQHFQYVADWQSLLQMVRRYAQARQLIDLLNLLEQPLIPPENAPQWMQGGWFMLQQLIRQLAILPKYRNLQTVAARRELLARQQEKLRTFIWEVSKSPLPPFFKGGESTTPPFFKGGESTTPPFEKGESATPPFEKGGESTTHPFSKEGESATLPFEKGWESTTHPFSKGGESATPPFEKGGQGGFIQPYWQTIGNALKDQWITILQTEFQQAKELLSLQITFPQTSLLSGRQTLTVRVFNPTSTLAKQLSVTFDNPPDHLFWLNRTMQYPLLEGNRQVDLRFECQIDEAGQYLIQGQLTATDLDDHPLLLPFSCQLNAAVAGKIYSPPPYQPYFVGAGLNTERTFVGRTDLLEWLGSWWRQPEGKPAMVLVGQRRIGKTSLLEKIRRDGLQDTHLFPIFINIQEISSDYGFLNTAYRRMTTALNLTPIDLATTEPYEAFKTFLYQVKPQLGNNRFLLMIDEADLIPDRQLGDLLPGFLRSLMQQADYPTLLLFCGTYRLKQAAWNYSSILFNTAQFKTVSYLTPAESAEVLQKPVRLLNNLLEFDDFVLEQAFKLTHGQPLLLQSLGVKLIEEFNETVRRKEQRSTFVNFNDLEQAAQRLAKEDNAAFLEHWIHSDIATHRLLSVLAWGTDELNRLQLDMDTIEHYLREHRLEQNFPRKLIFDTVQRLVNEEILATAGVGYCFAVPLYRRWIQWKYPPLKIREEGNL